MTVDSIGTMRIALVSPYSWTFPGGVTRHIDSLARELLAAGHHVRVLAPADPDDRITHAVHRQRPSTDDLPDFVMPLGRTIALPMNGAVTRLSSSPEAVVRMRRELRDGRYDVIHVHEPITPMLAWDACISNSAPVVGTFHVYSSSWIPNAIARGLGASRLFNHLHARIAVSEAARWTGERYFGGRYEVIPNGVHLDAAPSGPKPPGGELRILFVGREEERKGLPVLLSAFAGLRRHIPTRLDIVGAPPESVEPLLAEVEGGMESVEAHGHVSDTELWRHLHGADVLCAPSLGGESFGMVLTEAFAAGTPVVRLRHRRLPAGRHAWARRRARPARTAARARRGAPRAVARPRPPAGDGHGRAPPRRRLRLAPRGRARGGRLRAGDRRTGACRRHAAGEREIRISPGRHVAAPARTAPPVDRARTAARSAHPPSPRARGRPARGARDLGRARPAAGVPRATPGGLRERRLDAGPLEPELGADRACALLDFDDPEGDLLVRDRARRASGPTGQAAHDLQRHGDRRAHVGDAARPPR